MIYCNPASKSKMYNAMTKKKSRVNAKPADNLLGVATSIMKLYVTIK